MIQFTDKELEAISTDVKHVINHCSMRAEDAQIRVSILNKIHQATKL